MVKKVLPKTPESIFESTSPANNSRSSAHQSRTPSPRIKSSPKPLSPRQSRSPSPKIPTKKNNIFMSNITFYISFALTFSLGFFLFCNIFQNFVDIDISSSSEFKCPDNAECEGTVIKCKEDYFQFESKCFKKGGSEEKAIKLIQEIEETINEHPEFDVEDISNKLGLQKDIVELAIDLSDKYDIEDGKIEFKEDNFYAHLILYILFFIFLVIFILSVYYRRKNSF